MAERIAALSARVDRLALQMVAMQDALTGILDELRELQEQE